MSETFSTTAGIFILFVMLAVVWSPVFWSAALVVGVLVIFAGVFEIGLMVGRAARARRVAQR